MKTLVTIISLLFVSLTAQAQQLDTFYKEADAFFSKHVTNGKVDYKAVAKDPAALNKILGDAANIKVDVSDAKNFQAFWINAYNLAVIKGIIEKYPVKSPLDIKGFFDKAKYNLGGKNITLNDIENKLLRANFNDARVHFVLVCAGLGCPPLIAEAYTPEKLDAQMTQQTKIALNNPKFLRVNAKKKRVQFSQIMEWYNKDFVKKGQNLIDFANKYRTEKIPSNYKTSYYQYDWSLNGK